MNRIDAMQIYNLSRALDFTGGFLAQGATFPTGNMGRAVAEKLGQIRPLLEQLGLRLSLLQLDRVARICAKPTAPTGDVVCELGALTRRISDELSLTYLLLLPQEAVTLWEPPGPPFGAEVAGKFPSSAYDISEAAKCLALGRDTACVLHLMRALEEGILALAKHVNICDLSSNWGTLLDQIEKSIRSMSSTTHGPGWKTEKQFRAEAASHFRLLKDAWRNYAMHGHDRYDAAKALEIWQSAKSFMRHLATKLAE